MLGCNCVIDPVLVFSTEKSTVINEHNQKIRSLAAYGSYHCFFMLKRQFRQAARAQRIAFLGFAFHRQNIELLFSGQNMEEKKRNCRVYATAYGISYPDILLIKQDVVNLAGISDEQIYFEPTLKCSQLFSEYWRSLSLL